MPAERPGRLRRIEWRLPLTIVVLLIAVVAAFSWAAYREVRTAALRTAEARVNDVATQLAELLATSADQLLTEARAAADNPLLTAAAARSSAEAYVRAGAVLAARVEDSDQVLGVELWDTSGVLLSAAGRPSGGQEGTTHTFPEWVRDSTRSASPFRLEEDELRYDVAVAVHDEDRRIGYLVHHLRLNAAPGGAHWLEGLIGSRASFKLGVPGTVWTDLADVVEGPPEGPVRTGRPARYQIGDGRGILGVAAPVRGTPWLAWVEFPMEAVLQRPRSFLSWIAPLGFVVVGLGALAGAVLSRRITTRLRRLTSAAGAIATGQEGRRVPTGGADELDELARAFNLMVERVEDSHHRLEDRVVARTAALKASEERFRTLAATAPDAIVTADEDGRITYFNRGAERVFGREATEVLGEQLTILMPERYQEPYLRGLERWASADEPPLGARTTELTGLRADGSEFPLELSLAALHQGGAATFTGIIRDVTDRKRREEELRRYASELEAANRELEAFSYSVSHDLRAPLRGIHGFSQAVLEDYENRLDEQAVDYLNRVCAAAERMGVLIDDLLELSRATRSEMRLERVDLSGLAERAADELAAATPDRDVDVRIARNLTALGDRKLLALVFDNLMGNAWKFTSHRDPAHIEVGASNGGERAFFVRDDGAGFDMTYADKLFDPFQRLHSANEFDGTGIGLAIVQRIVHRHGGRVWGEGAVDQGATFHFTLPPP